MVAGSGFAGPARAAMRAVRAGRIAVERAFPDRCEVLRAGEVQSATGAVVPGPEVRVAAVPCLFEETGTQPNAGPSAARFIEGAEGILHLPVGTEVRVTDAVRVVRTGKRWRILRVQSDNPYALDWPLAVRS